MISCIFTDEPTKVKLVKGQSWYLNPGPRVLKPQVLPLPCVSGWARGRKWPQESSF